MRESTINEADGPDSFFLDNTDDKIALAEKSKKEEAAEDVDKTDEAFDLMGGFGRV